MSQANSAQLEAWLVMDIKVILINYIKLHTLFAKTEQIRYGAVNG